MKEIALLLADVCSVEFVIPILSRTNFAEVEIFVDPAGVGNKVLEKHKIKFTFTQDFDPSEFDLVVCGTNGKATTLEYNATLNAKRTGKEVVWLGDFYLSGCGKKEMSLEPDWLTVIDQQAKAMVRKARPNFPEERIVVLGNPAFDKLAEISTRKQDIRDRIRKLFGLGQQEKLVVFSASASNQFAANEMDNILSELASYCDANDRVVLVASFHLADSRKVELENMVKTFTLSKDNIVEDSFNLLVAADAVLVQYSTEGVTSSLLVPTAFVMLSSIRQYQRGRGGRWPFFPQLQFGVAEGIWDLREIAPTLGRMLNGDGDYYEAIEEARHEHFGFLLDGRSGERVLEFIHNRLAARQT